MKDLETVLYDITFELRTESDCGEELINDLLLNVEELRQENDRLIKRMDSENNKDEVIKCLSDTSKDLLKYIHELKEDIKTLRKQNEQLMEQYK